MMAARDENILGGRELADLLSTLPAKVEGNIMRGALRDGAKVLLPEVVRNIPKDSGDLAATARISTRNRKGQVSASVKVGNNQVWYAHLVEHATRPHVIRAKPGSALNVNGREVTRVEHPGTRGQPFMRPAIDTQFQAVIAAVQAGVRRRLTKRGIEVPDPTPAGEREE